MGAFFFLKKIKWWTIGRPIERERGYMSHTQKKKKEKEKERKEIEMHECPFGKLFARELQSFFPPHLVTSKGTKHCCIFRLRGQWGAALFKVDWSVSTTAKSVATARHPTRSILGVF
jgi:hypothetical protein